MGAEAHFGAIGGMQREEMSHPGYLLGARRDQVYWSQPAGYRWGWQRWA